MMKTQLWQTAKLAGPGHGSTITNGADHFRKIGSGAAQGLLAFVGIVFSPAGSAPPHVYSRVSERPARAVNFDLPQARQTAPNAVAAQNRESSRALGAMWRQDANGTLVCEWSTNGASPIA